MVKWTPKDVIAGVITVGCLIMVACGIDSYVKYTLLVVTSLYFGVDIATMLRLIKAEKAKKEE